MSILSSIFGTPRRAFVVAALLAAAFFILAPTSRASGGPVTGSVKEADGTTAVTSGNVSIHTSNWSYSDNVSLGSSGGFSFYNVPAGNYVVEVWPSNSALRPDPINITVAEGESVSLGTIRLLAANVFGKVTRSDGTTAVTNASVTLRTFDWSTSRYANVDSNGVFQLVTTTPGTYVLEVYAWDTTESRPDNVCFNYGTFASPNATCTSYAAGNLYFDGTNSSIPLKLNAAAMQGKILIPGGAGAQYASLTLYNSDNMGVQWGSTDSNGDFKIDSVATGTYRLRINPPSSPAGLAAPDDITIALTKGTTNTTYTTSPITLTTSVKTISGRVTRASTGAAITDAYVSAWQPMGGGYASTQVDGQGYFSLTVSSGNTWELSTWPSWNNYTAGQTPDWTYDGTPVRVSFSLPNAQAETQTANFSVLTYSATLQGTIYDPAGNPVSGTVGYYGVSTWRDRGAGGNWSQVDSAGHYTMKLVPGTFNVNVYGSNDYGAPQSAITIKENETLTHNITLLAKNATIAGLVQDDQGRPISNQWCSAWVKNGSGWSSASTGSDGRYSMPVTSGTWFVSCYPSGSAGATGSPMTSQSASTSYVSTQPPQEVVVAANASASADFTFAVANSTLAGKLVDENRASISSVYGWIEARRCSSANETTNTYGYYGGLGGSIINGTFSIRVPRGCWRLRASVGYAGDYSSSSVSTKEVTIGSGETVSDIELQLIPNNATVSGTVVNASGTKIADAYGSVFLTDGSDYRWAPITNGTYTLKTGAGQKNFGCWLDWSTTNRYYMPGTCEGTVTAVANQTVTHDITLREADSTITVATLKPDGTPLPNALVAVGTSFGNTKTISYAMYGSWFNPDRMTDQNGLATFNVPAGTYFVSASIAADLGYMKPARQVVTASADAPADVTLKFTQPDATITGTVTRGGAAYTGGGAITGFSDEGAYAETTLNDDGSFSLGVTKDDTWTLKAATDDSLTAGLTSGAVDVNVPASGSASATVALDESVTLPDRLTTTFATTTDQTLSSGDFKIDVPANSLSATSVNVSLTVTPTVEGTPDTATESTVGPAYDIKATKTSGSDAGSPITDLNGAVTVTVPYTAAQLTEKGITDEDQLTVKSWDTTSDTYAAVEGVVVNETTKTIAFTTRHLTKFVITTTPVEQQSTGGTTPGGDGGTQQTPVVTPDFVELKTRDLAVLYQSEGPIIALFNQSGKLTKRFRPFARGVAGTFGLMAADVDPNTPGEELLVWGSAGQRLPIRIFSLAGKRRGETPSGSGGWATLKSADLNGDGTLELVAGEASARHLTVYGWASGKLKRLVRVPTGLGGTQFDVLAGRLTSPTADQIAVVPHAGSTIKIYGVNLTRKRAAVITSLPGVTLRTEAPRVALADVLRTSLKEIVIWPADGSSKVRLLGLNSKGKLATLMTATIRSARALALGDLDGNGKTDIIALTSTTGQPTVRLFSAKKNVVTATTVASLRDTSGTPYFSLGDFDANGTTDLIVARSNSSLVTLYTYQRGSKKLKALTSRYVGSRTAKTGYSVFTTDLDGDGRREIAVPSLARAKTLTLLKLQDGKLVINRQLKPAGSAAAGPYTVTAAGTD